MKKLGDTWPNQGLKSNAIDFHRSKNFENERLIGILFCVSRQAEFLHEIAAGYEVETGLDHWWIGLTDLSKYFK